MKYTLRLLVAVASVMLSTTVRAQDLTIQLPKEGTDIQPVFVAIEFTGSKRISSEEIIGFMKYCKLGGPFDLEKFETDLVRIRELLYADRGYWRAQLGRPHITYTDQGVKATVSVSEGLRYRVGTVTVEDATVMPAERIKEILAIRSGDILSGSAINEGIKALKKAYGALGYIALVVDISPEWKDPIAGSDDGVADFTFSMTEGAPYTIRKITLMGNTVSTDDALLRIFGVKTGSLCNMESIDRGVDRLNKLGRFDGVFVLFNTEDQTRQVDVTVHLTPKASGQ